MNDDHIDKVSEPSGAELVVLGRATPQPMLPELVVEEVASAKAYADAATAVSTRRAYASDWEIFTAWCAARGIDALPVSPATVAVFLSSEADAGVSPSTIGRRLAAIGYHHRSAGFDAPQSMPGAEVLRRVLAGIRRTKSVKKKRKRPAQADMLRDMLRAIDGDAPRDVRDRALLAIGMAGAFRRSELVALDRSDIEDVPEGLRITIRRSKTDQEAEGQKIVIPEGKRIRPKALLLAWLELAGVEGGPVFRKMTPQGRISPKRMSDKGVALVVKARAAAAGYEESDYSGHSLRSGFLTEAARQRASIFKMRDQSRHKSLDVLADYVRDQELFDDHAGERFL